MTHAQKFQQDCLEQVGFLTFYKGRHFYEGPAIEVHRVDGIESVSKVTNVPLRQDDMGKNHIVVYPLNPSMTYVAKDPELTTSRRFK